MYIDAQIFNFNIHQLIIFIIFFIINFFIFYFCILKYFFIYYNDLNNQVISYDQKLKLLQEEALLEQNNYQALCKYCDTQEQTLQKQLYNSNSFLKNYIMQKEEYYKDLINKTAINIDAIDQCEQYITQAIKGAIND